MCVCVPQYVPTCSLVFSLSCQASAARRRSSSSEKATSVALTCAQRAEQALLGACATSSRGGYLDDIPRRPCFTTPCVATTK